MLPEFARMSCFAVLLLCHCSFVGSAVRRTLLPGAATGALAGNPYLDVFLALSAGLVIDIAGLFVLGLVGAFSRAGVLCLGLVLVMLAWGLHRRRGGVPVPSFPHGGAGRAAVDGLVVALLLASTVLAALHAPGYWDDTMYHLPLARSYVQHGAIVVSEYLRFPLFPQNVNLLLALGLMWGGDLLAQVFATLPLFMMALGLIGASQWAWGSRLPGAGAAVALFFILPVASTLGYAYIDNGLALFCWGAVLALAFAVEESAQPARATGWVVLAGLLAGAAAGSKFFGAAFVAFAGLGFLLVRRDWWLTAVFGGVVLLTGCWWYVRSFWISGDPVHPAGGNFFGHFLWNAADLLSQKQEQATHGVPPTLGNFLAGLKKAGVSLWVLALLGLPLRRVPVPLRLLQLVFVAYLAFWFIVSQVDRYLAPVYCLGMFLSAYTLCRGARWLVSFLPVPVPRRRGRAVAGALALGFVLLPLTWHNYRRAENDMVNLQVALRLRPGHELFARASQLTPRFGGRLVQLGFENAVYFFDGVVIGDWFGPGRYSQMIECRPDGCGVLPPQAMKALMQGFDARMLAISTVRFPKFDSVAYGQYFDLVMQNKDGLLLKLK